MTRTEPLPPGSAPPAVARPGASLNGDPLTPEFSASRLTESGDPYRLLFESNPNPMWVYDVETLEFLAVNEAAVDSYGYDPDEFLGMTIRDIRPPEDVSALTEHLEGNDRDAPSLWRHCTKDGSLIDVEIRS